MLVDHSLVKANGILTQGFLPSVLLDTALKSFKKNLPVPVEKEGDGYRATNAFGVALSQLYAALKDQTPIYIVSRLACVTSSR